MTATAHQVVGLIEVPADGSWSADALVKECLGIRAHAWEEERFVITGRLVAKPAFESARLVADLPVLRDELQELLEGFLDHCP